MRCVVILVLLSFILVLPLNAADWTVVVGNYSFDPSPIVIHMGDTVHWVWDSGRVEHSTTSDPDQAESWDSGPHATATMPFVFEHTFTKVGTCSYHCSVHTSMRGQVIVAPESSSLLGSGPRVEFVAWHMMIESLIRQRDGDKPDASASTALLYDPTRIMGG